VTIQQSGSNFSESPASAVDIQADTFGHSRPRRLLRKHESLLLICQVLGNSAVVALALIFCTLYKMQDVPSLYRLLLVIAVFTVFVVYPLSGVYKQTEKFYTMAFRISIAWMATIAVLIVLAFLTKTSELYSREVIITWFLVVGLVQVPLLRLNYFAVSMYRKNHTKPINNTIFTIGISFLPSLFLFG